MRDNMVLARKLEAFLEDFKIGGICHRLANQDGLAPIHVNEILHTFANEARVTLALVEKFLNSEMRILEVGAGICLFAIFLRSENYHVVGLEPALGGFSDFAKIKNAVLAYYSDIAIDILSISAQELDGQKHGEFDLIYSNNVIEHIPDLCPTFSAMTGVLSKNGLMVHGCPNYVIPYEPHFGIPVIKKFPELSRRLFPKRIETNSDLWDSLNFISYFNVKALAAKCHLKVKFKKGVLYDSLLRIGADKCFRERHMNKWILSLFSLFQYLGLVRVVRYLPPYLSTPMIVMLSHRMR